MTMPDNFPPALLRYARICPFPTTREDLLLFLAEIDRLRAEGTRAAPMVAEQPCGFGPEWLEAIKARRLAATSLPWRVRGGPSGRIVESAAPIHSFTGVAFSHRADAVFVAHAPEDIDTLLAALDASRRRVEALTEALERAEDAGDALGTAVNSHIRQAHDQAGYLSLALARYDAYRRHRPAGDDEGGTGDGEGSGQFARG